VHGLRDLFWLPIEQYRKDGRIIRGLQRGAASFGTTTAALELSNRLVQAIQATAETIYDILSPTAPPMTRALLDRKHTHKQRRGQQPADLREGVAKAYDTVRESIVLIINQHHILLLCSTYIAVTAKNSPQSGLRTSRSSPLRVPPPPLAPLTPVHRHAALVPAPLQGVIDTAQAICDVATRGHEQKGITGAVGGVLRQIPPTVVKPLVASEATSNLLGGMRNQIKPDTGKEESLKWWSEDAQE
ncbi:hypothetical protein lerEdw1_015207, partial [Lerista edwardsae]